VDAAIALGCANVSLCPGHSLKEQGKANAMRSLTKSVHELTKYANDNGVVLFMEPAHPFETDLLLTVQDTIEFIETNNFDGMGICMDTGHCHINGEPLADTVKEISDHDIPMHIHIDDNGGYSDDHLIPGEGTIDYPPFFKALNEIKYTGFITAELGWKYTADPDQAVDTCLVNLKNLEK
jgi:sugar phosphate isomerase/epimerase